MRFPDVLTVDAQESRSGAPAENVAIVLILFAARKNDYYVGPLIANEKGQVEFTRAECESAIRRAKEMFVMDYEGDLMSCGSVVEIRLHSPEHIQAMLQQHKQSPDFWGQAFREPERFFAKLRTVRNADYELAQIRATEEQLLNNPQIKLSLVRKTPPNDPQNGLGSRQN